jgi:hypothetical protein
MKCVDAIIPDKYSKVIINSWWAECESIDLESDKIQFPSFLFKEWKKIYVSVPATMFHKIPMGASLCQPKQVY